ncbi:MAG TPA: BrnA antitoxin family protein [Albidovulum sp.]|uniref:BrnA antitoxin family protein n=1 Tax=Albidovulum sp. TaxID=1872424 RepID=UPI002CF66000|nr:BrnA antitoxin family protein [Albidovulum sp.]
MTRPRSGKEAAAYHHLAGTLRGLEEDLRWGLQGSARIPSGWDAILREVTAPAKVKLTLRLDADVVRFFRAMGAGHLPRMNAVLRAFMLARLAGVLKGAEGVDYAPTDADEVNGLRREIMALMQEEEVRREKAAKEAMVDPAERAIRLRALREMRDERIERKLGDEKARPKGR